MAKLILSVEYTAEELEDGLCHNTSLILDIDRDSGKSVYLEAYAGFLKALTFSITELTDADGD